MQISGRGTANKTNSHLCKGSDKHPKIIQKIARLKLTLTLRGGLQAFAPLLCLVELCSSVVLRTPRLHGLRLQLLADLILCPQRRCQGTDLIKEAPLLVLAGLSCRSQVSNSCALRRIIGLHALDGLLQGPGILLYSAGRLSGLLMLPLSVAHEHQAGCTIYAKNRCEGRKQTCISRIMNSVGPNLLQVLIDLVLLHFRSSEISTESPRFSSASFCKSNKGKYKSPRGYNKDYITILCAIWQRTTT